jgi:hypothetical protein
MRSALQGVGSEAVGFRHGLKSAAAAGIGAPIVYRPTPLISVMAPSRQLLPETPNCLRNSPRLADSRVTGKWNLQVEDNRLSEGYAVIDN